MSVRFFFFCYYIGLKRLMIEREFFNVINCTFISTLLSELAPSIPLTFRDLRQNCMKGITFRTSSLSLVLKDSAIYQLTLFLSIKVSLYSALVFFVSVFSVSVFSVSVSSVLVSSASVRKNNFFASCKYKLSRFLWS